VSEERFDKIRYYLKHGKYPNGADRAEKSRLRSAATHYKLLPPEEGINGEERLMLKDKEVVADAQRQYEIARGVHAQGHGGINKTTATIAERYHWVRIKETVSLVIKNCGECKEGGKVPPSRSEGIAGRSDPVDPNSRIERLVTFGKMEPNATTGVRRGVRRKGMGGDLDPGRAPVARMGQFDGMPLDPQIMVDGQTMEYGQQEGDAEGEDYGMNMDHDGGVGEGAGGMGYHSTSGDVSRRHAGEIVVDDVHGGQLQRQLLEATFGPIAS
jgi:hypothetical protein